MAGQAQTGSALNMALFEAYFERADLDGDGRIGGKDAVSFFRGSNLSKQVLAQIWGYADTNRTGFLGRAEFYNALKLVTVAQSGRKLTPEVVQAALYGRASPKIPAPQIDLAVVPGLQSNTGVGTPATGVAGPPAAPQSIGIRGPQGGRPGGSQGGVTSQPSDRGISLSPSLNLDGSGVSRLPTPPRQQITSILSQSGSIKPNDTASLGHEVPNVAATTPSNIEDVELAMAIKASLQSAAEERLYHLERLSGARADTSTSWNSTLDVVGQSNVNVPSPSLPGNRSNIGGELQEAGQSSSSDQHIQTQNNTPIFPSAPPAADTILADGPVPYPSIDTSPLHLSSPSVGASYTGANRADTQDTGPGASSCVICLDAQVEGACVPCGHMAGCMSCLNEIVSKKWGCPVCRAKIDLVIRLYAV